MYVKYLLDERSTRLSEGVPDDIHGGLALGLLLSAQVDVRHLLTRVEQRILTALRQDVLRAKKRKTTNKQAATR